MVIVGVVEVVPLIEALEQYQSIKIRRSKIKNKVSSGSGLPVLKCVANDNTHTDIIDLQLLKDKTPHG